MKQPHSKHKSHKPHHEHKPDQAPRISIFINNNQGGQKQAQRQEQEQEAKGCIAWIKKLCG